MSITVVSIGTGSHELLTLQTAACLRSGARVVLRTGRCPVARWLESEGVAFETLDSLYDACEDFDTFTRAAVVRLLTIRREAPVCYAVADAAFDETVAALVRLCPADAQLCLLAGVSHAQRCMAQCALPASGVRLYSAEDFRTARMSPDEATMLTELHSKVCAGDCKLKLLSMLPEDAEVRFFTGDESGGLAQKTIPLYELDRQPAYDHQTAAYIPAVEMLKRKRFDMDDLRRVMVRLRAPDGCPWDRAQTHESLLPNLLEECYEYLSAVREQDVDHMYDELGDVLLQVALHAEIARQCGEFDFDDVTTAITGKMIQRHTHIFGDVKADTAEQVLDNWEALKRKQRGITTHADAMRGVSAGLSALMRARKVQGKAAKVGFDFSSPEEALGKVGEEMEEVLRNLQSGDDPTDELGDLLFSAVNVVRLCGKDPDIALHAATEKFIRRFDGMEKTIKNAGNRVEGLTLSEMDVYWEAEKRNEEPV